MIARIMAWFCGLRRKNLQPVETQLTDASKEEALILARTLFLQGVNVRSQQADEVASSIPEVGEVPLDPEKP